jgi:cyclophilin family peptidyl-prolyl cis-trans isomerase
MNLRSNIVIAASLMLLLASTLWAEDKKSSSEADEFRQVFGQWKSLLGDLAERQAKDAAESASGKFALKPPDKQLVKQAEEILPKLQAAAEKAYLADDKNKQIADLLFAMSLAHLRNDNYEEALRLANLLIEHKFPAPDVLQAHRIAASSAFATMQLDEAKKHIEAASGGKETKDESLLELLAQIEQFQPMWEREQKLRAGEVKADDLPRVKLQTSQGDIVVELFENEAPNTVANFISLVEKDFYNGTQFHRVLPGFMAQGGDPLSKDPAANAGQIGHGGPAYTIADECHEPNHREHFRGSLSMAKTDQPNTGGSQFFLTFVPTSSLNGRHTVFGRVIDGIDVLAKLQRLDPEKPSGETPDTIIKAEVLRKRKHEYEPKKQTL